MKKFIVCTTEARKIFDSYNKNSYELPQILAETIVEIRGKLKGVRYTGDTAIILYTKPYCRVLQNLKVDKKELINVHEV